MSMTFERENTPHITFAQLVNPYSYTGQPSDLDTVAIEKHTYFIHRAGPYRAVAIHGEVKPERLNSILFKALEAGIN